MFDPDSEDQRDKLHQICWVFLGLLGTFLQTLFHPFERHHAKAVAFIFTIGTYFLLLLVELVLRSNGRKQVIVGILSLSFGVLAVILEVLIINPLFGWFAFGMGCVVFVSILCRWKVQIRNDFANTVEEIMRVMNALWNGMRVMNALWNGNNEQEVNGMRDELRTDNAIEPQVNGMQDELRNANEQQQVNGMPDENQQQHQHCELPV